MYRLFDNMALFFGLCPSCYCDLSLLEFLLIWIICHLDSRFFVCLKYGSCPFKVLTRKPFLIWFLVLLIIQLWIFLIQGVDPSCFYSFLMWIQDVYIGRVLLFNLWEYCSMSFIDIWIFNYPIWYSLYIVYSVYLLYFNHVALELRIMTFLI